MKNKILLAALFLVSQCLGIANATADEPLVLGVFPRFAATAVHDTYSPLAKYLSTALGREVRLETAKDQNAFWEAVTTKRYDIVHYNQMNYIESHQKFGYDVIAMNEEFGKGTVAAAIVVRKDAGINSLDDLRGKTVVFGGGPKAMIAYVANVALLQRAGLKKGDYKEEFAKTPANAIMAVFFKQAAAGGAGDIGLKVQSTDEKVNADDLKFLAVGEQLPHLPWAVKSSLGPDLAKKIQDALLKLKDTADGQQLLKQAQINGFLAAKDSDYDSCRKVIKEVFGDAPAAK